MFYCKVWFLDNALFLEQSVFAIALLSIYFPGESGNRSSQGFPAKKIFISILVSINFYRTRVRSLVMLVSDSLTNSCLVNLIDVTLACEDANSKLVEVVSVADVDAEDHVGNSMFFGS